MKLRTLIFAIIALLPLVSCGNRAVSAQLDDIESYIQERPDSALAILQAIDTNNLNTRALEAKYSLLHAMALDKNYIDTTDIAIIEPAVNYYRKHGNASEKLKSYYYLGRLNFNGKEYNKAIVAYSNALSFVEDANDDYYTALLYSAISMANNRTYDYEEALRYSIMASKAFEKEHMDFQKLLVDFHTAQNHGNLSHWEQADSLFSTLILSPEFQVRPILLAEIQSSYAYMLLSAPEPDFTKARNLFETAITKAGRLNNASQWGAYALSLAATGNALSAYGILEQIKDNYELEYAYWLSRVQILTGNSTEAYYNLDKTVLISNESIIRTFAKSLSKSQRDFYEEQNLLLKARSDNMTLLMILIILGVCLILFIVFYAVKQKIKQAKDEKTRLVEIIKTSNVQMNYYKERYEDERISIQKEFRNQYREQFQYLNTIGEAILAANDSKAPANHVYRAVKKMLNDIGKDESGQTKFEEMVNDRMDGIVSLFRKDFPNLKEKDYRFVTYFFAGFNANLISILTDYPSLPAVYTRKSRMRAMIEESSSENKETYLEMIG